MKKWVFVLLVGLVCLRADAAPLSQEVALDRARAWMENHPVMGSMSRTLDAVEIFPEAGALYPLFVVRLSPTGYLVLNSDARLPLVVSFSASSRVDLTDSPENAFLNGRVGRIGIII